MPLLGTWKAAWGLDGAFPEACTECKTNIAALTNYYSTTYPTSRFSLLSYDHDNVISTFFKPAGAFHGFGDVIVLIGIAAAGAPATCLFGDYRVCRLGATVYFEIDKMPGMTAVAVGAFADEAFPPPIRSMYSERKHAWVELPQTIERA